MILKYFTLFSLLKIQDNEFKNLKLKDKGTKET